MKKNGFHIIFNYFIGCCILFTSAGALAEGGGGGGGSGEIILPVSSCDDADLLYMETTVDPPVLCSGLVLSGHIATNGDFPPGDFPPTDPNALCRVYTYIPSPSADKLSLPVRAELDAGIYDAIGLTFYQAGVGDAAQYLKGDIFHRVAEADAGIIKIIVANDFPPEEMIVRIKNLGGGNQTNYCTAPAPALTFAPPPPLFYENTLKVEERVVKNGKCNVRIEGTCGLAKAVGWKCTDEGKAFVIGGGGPGLCQQDDSYTTVPGAGATYCEPKIVDDFSLSATSGGNQLFNQEYFDGEEQCYNENPITNAGPQSFSCFWWASPPFCF